MRVMSKIQRWLEEEGRKARTGSNPNLMVIQPPENARMAELAEESLFPSLLRQVIDGLCAGGAKDEALLESLFPSPKPSDMTDY